MSSDLLTEYIQHPLHCVLDCEPVWKSEILGIHLARDGASEAVGKRLHFRSIAIREWQRQPLFQMRRGVVIWQPATSDIHRVLIQIFELSDRGTRVVLVGDAILLERRLELLAAGASALFTELSQVERLYESVNRVATLQPPVLATWRDRFENRMPWADWQEDRS